MSAIKTFMKSGQLSASRGCFSVHRTEKDISGCFGRKKTILDGKIEPGDTREGPTLDVSKDSSKIPTSLMAVSGKIVRGHSIRR
jgi:hypothetical protein